MLIVLVPLVTSKRVKNAIFDLSLNFRAHGSDRDPSNGDSRRNSPIEIRNFDASAQIQI